MASVEVKVNDPSAMTPEEIAQFSGSFVYPVMNSEMPTGTYFFMMWLKCTDDHICAFSSTESPFTLTNGVLKYTPQNTTSGYNGIYVQVMQYNPITTGLTVAAAILSCVGPIFFIVYYYLDAQHYSKTGKPLAW